MVLDSGQHNLEHLNTLYKTTIFTYMSGYVIYHSYYPLLFVLAREGAAENDGDIGR